MVKFVDRVTLHLEAGKGGNGVASVHREKFKPLGGPDGANGGHGGDIILRVDGRETTLLHLHHSPHLKAENGGQGEGGLRHGKRGADLIVSVPNGTVVKDTDGNILADLVGLGAQYVAAEGGFGGLGNAALASPKRRAPGFALLGDEGEKRDLILELKSVADVALVGFPSAGKSSLIAAMSAARPKIADYPFTTLVPNLGVAQFGEYRYTLADVPGLIPGAAEGKGLGLEFLRHIERCATIVHVLDCAASDPSRDPLSDLDLIESELASYASRVPPIAGQIPLPARPRVVVLNKIDLPQAREIADSIRDAVKKRSLPVFSVSAVSREGLKALGYGLGQIVTAVRESEKELSDRQPRTVIRPLGNKSGCGFTVRLCRRGEQRFFQIRGTKVERLVRQTDFSNDEAVGYLSDRLNSLGIEKELYRAGAQAGEMVVIGPEEGGMIFDWEPTVSAVAQVQGPRGTDLRLEENRRSTRKEKKAFYHERMDAKQAAREELRAEREQGKWVTPDGERDR